MAVFNGLKTLNKGIAKVYQVLCIVLLGVMCLLAVVEVVRRYVFKVSFMWSDEALRYMSVWLTFFGGALVFRKVSMTVFDLFIGKLKSKARKIADLAVLVVSLVFVVFIFIKSVQYSFSGPVVNEISSGTHISMLVPYISMPCCFGAMILFGIEQAVNMIMSLAGKEVEQ